MKHVLVFESFLLEQAPENIMDKRFGIEDRNIKALGLDPNNRSDVQKYRESVYGPSFTGHQVAAILQIGTAFIPIFGPFISAGIGFLEAKSYWDEGDKQAAAITAVLSTIPLVLEIPGVKNLTSKAIESIVSKLSGKGGKLTQAEVNTLNSVVKNQDKVVKELERTNILIKKIYPEAKQLKPNFVKAYGEDAYSSLLNKLISGKISTEEFLSTLKSVSSSTLMNLSQISKLGIKFEKQELDFIESILPNALEKEASVESFRVASKTGSKDVNIAFLGQKEIDQIFPGRTDLENTLGVTRGNDIIIFKDKLKPGESTEKIRALIIHEVAHAKDPAKVASPKLISTYVKKDEVKTLENYFNHQFEITANLSSSIDSMKKGFQKLSKTTPKGTLKRYLDSIINLSRDFSMPAGGTVDSQALEYLLGRDGRSQILNLLKGVAENPKLYRPKYLKFMSKLAQEAMRLKSLL